jgi:transposase-like protein
MSSRSVRTISERSIARMNHRNGYRERPWETRAGTVDLAIPKTGTCSLPRRGRQS